MNHCPAKPVLYEFYPYSAGIDLSRQILTTKFDPRTVRANIFLIAVDPYQSYRERLRTAEKADVWRYIKCFILLLLLL